MALLYTSRRFATRSEAWRVRKRHSCARRWRRICARDAYVCWLCHQPIDPTARVPHDLAPTVDHVVPLAAGGSDDDGNLRAAHFSCNSRRGATPV